MHFCINQSSENLHHAPPPPDDYWLTPREPGNSTFLVVICLCYKSDPSLTWSVKRQGQEGIQKSNTNIGKNFFWEFLLSTYHLNSLNRDNYQFWVSLPYIFLENNFRVHIMLFTMPSEDLHIAAKFDPGLSRLSESRWYMRGPFTLTILFHAR